LKKSPTKAKFHSVLFAKKIVMNNVFAHQTSKSYGAILVAPAFCASTFEKHQII